MSEDTIIRWHDLVRTRNVAVLVVAPAARAIGVTRTR